MLQTPVADGETHAPHRRLVRRQDLVVLSCLLPFHDDAEEPDEESAASVNELAAALLAVSPHRSAAWIGSAGRTGGLATRFGRAALWPLVLNASEQRHCYDRFTRGVLGPLLHEQPPALVATDEDWLHYQAVNQRFASAAALALRPGGSAWVHGLELMLVPQLLRQLRPDVRIGFLQHGPMPRARYLNAIARGREILDGLLGADLVGFDTPADTSRFLAQVGLRHPVRLGRVPVVELPGRRVKCAPHPRSARADKLRDLAFAPPVQARAAQLRRALGVARRLVLVVDAPGSAANGGSVEHAMCDGLLRVREPACVVVHIAVDDVGRHSLGPPDVEGARTTEVGCVHHPRGLPPDQLVAHLLAADALCTPAGGVVRDQVIEDFLTVCRPDAGVLLSGEGAVPAALRTAIHVPAYSALPDGLARALALPIGERMTRVAVMRRNGERRRALAWANSYLRMLGEDHAR